MLGGRGQRSETGPKGRDRRMLSQRSQESQTTGFCAVSCLLLKLTEGLGSGQPEGRAGGGGGGREGWRDEGMLGKSGSE